MAGASRAGDAVFSGGGTRNTSLSLGSGDPANALWPIRRSAVGVFRRGCVEDDAHGDPAVLRVL